MVGRIQGYSLCSRWYMVLCQCRPPLLSQQIHALDVTISTSSHASWHPQLWTQNLLPANNPPVERPWQRICQGDYHRLIQESPTLVRRRRSSTWYPTLGVCRLRSRSRSRSRRVINLCYNVTITSLSSENPPVSFPAGSKVESQPNLTLVHIMPWFRVQ